MGIPVLHGVEGESAEIVRAHDVGVVFEPENAEALRDALAALVAAPLERRRFADNAVRAAPVFDRAVLAARMGRILERVAAA